MYISVTHAEKILGKTRVLRDISLSMESGYIYGFQGENGSGKTMLMRMIVGLIHPTRGRVYIDGEELGKKRTFPGNTGMLLENPAFLAPYSGLRNLELLAEISGMTDTDMLKMTMRRVGLNPDNQKKYRKYSLGMKQKLGIAAAIMGQPELLILDEPFNALDRNSAAKVKEIICEERDRGALIIMACHDKSTLEELCDRIIVLENGQIIQEYAGRN